MRPLPLALGAATLVAFAAVIGLAVYSEVVQHLPFLLLDTEFLAKVAIFLSLAVLGWAVLTPNRSGEANIRLNSMATLAAGLGLLITVVAFSTPDLVCVDPTKVDMLKVEGPSHAQDLMPLAFGLLAATVATARAGKQCVSA